MSQEQGKLTLDLGLEAILKTAEGPVASNPAPTPEAPPIEAPIVAPAPIPRNEFETLADAKEWPQLLKLCEERISASGTDVTESRLWWITAHLRTNGMPVSFLTAPLEAATQAITEQHGDDRLKSLASLTLADTARAVEKSGDGAVAVSLLQKASNLDRIHLKEFAATIDREVLRLQQLKDLSSSQLEDRNGKIRTLKALRPKEIPSPEERVLQAIRPLAKKKKRKKGGGFTLPVSTESIGAIKRMGVVGGAAFVAFYLLWTISSGAYHYITEESGQPSFSAGILSTPPSLRLVSVERIDSVSTFDGLYYDLKDHVDAGTPRARTQTPVVSQRNSTAPVPRIKEPLNLSEPREPSEMQAALSQPDPQAADPSAEILFGAGGAKDPVAAVASNSGGPQHVSHYNGHRVFKVIATTKILAQPSYQTEVLGTLNPGERVAGEARVDSWIQIRSVNGRVGFIFAQDAEPEA